MATDWHGSMQILGTATVWTIQLGSIRTSIFARFDAGLRRFLRLNPLAARVPPLESSAKLSAPSCKAKTTAAVKRVAEKGTFVDAPLRGAFSLRQ
ncbi:MAG: hypothetical protein DMG67_03830 [Acidobacteria bacterium]|nr:MAG: hypothetical protein DMG67_03830 [Acidobacteriota bacterium]